MINTPKGLVVVTGCAHPGILEIVDRARTLTGEKVHLVLGGFHLAGAGDRALRRILAGFENMGVEKIGPCHCSGERIRQLAEKTYGERFIPNGVGMVIRIEGEEKPTAKEKLDPADAVKIFDYVAGRKGISRAQAEKRLHLLVCKGGCDWYENRRDPQTFDPAKLTDADKQELEGLIREAGFDLETGKRLIHLYICHR